MADLVYQLPFPLAVASAPRRFPPVNRCIYCGTFSKHLGKEHIVPYGLAGDALVLPKASCKTCESITGKLEGTLLRAILGPFRIKIGAPTRHPNERPDTLELLLGRADRPSETPIIIGTKTIQAADFPLAFVGLRLRPPGILDGVPPNPGAVNGALWVRYSNDLVEKHQLADKHGIKLGQMHPDTFMRSLAKIGYAYAVALLGYGNFVPLVTSYILGNSDTGCQWVGGDWDIPEAQPILHHLELGTFESQGRRFVVLGVRLFPFFGTPQYHVVAGELREDQRGILVARF